jgi:hypothetical protein
VCVSGRDVYVSYVYEFVVGVMYFDQLGFSGFLVYVLWNCNCCENYIIVDVGDESCLVCSILTNSGVVGYSGCASWSG